MVDTGSRYTLVNKDMLKNLGIDPERVARFKRIDGRVLERTTGIAIIECGG